MTQTVDERRARKRARDLAYQKANLGKRRARYAARSDAERDRERAQRQARWPNYYAEHREEKLARERAYYAAHPEEMAAKRQRKRVNGSVRRYSAIYYAKHRDVLRAKSRADQISLAGQLIRISTLPPELRDLALLVREARQVLRRAS